MFFSLETKQLSAYLYPSGAVPFFQMTHNSYNFRTILEHFLYNLYVTPLRLEADPAQAFFTTAVISIHYMGKNGFLSGTAHLKVPELSLSSGFFVLLKSVLNLLYFSSSLFSLPDSTLLALIIHRQLLVTLGSPTHLLLLRPFELLIKLFAVLLGILLV